MILFWKSRDCRQILLLILRKFLQYLENRDVHLKNHFITARMLAFKKWDFSRNRDKSERFWKSRRPRAMQRSCIVSVSSLGFPGHCKICWQKICKTESLGDAGISLLNHTKNMLPFSVDNFSQKQLTLQGRLEEVKN